MANSVKTSVTELPESRVRVEAEVAPEELERRVQQAARELGRQMRIPGFRKGKVPPAVVIRRLGRDAVLDEVVRTALGGWYADAIDGAGIAPVGEPELDVPKEHPGEGQPLQFSIEIGVRPAAKLGEYKGLEVGRREPEVPDAQIEQEIEAMRERLARLQTAERPAAAGDYVVVDYVGALASGSPGEEPSWEPFEGGEGRDQLVELGAGNLIPGFEEGLLGASAGDTRTVALRFPDDYGNERLAGREASFEVRVKEVKLKELPAVDEDFAVDAGFDDLQELREDIRRRLTELEESRIEGEFLRAALDAAVAEARVGLTPDLVKARAREMWERTLHSLAHRGISREAYLLAGLQPGELQAGDRESAAARREQEILTEIEPDAELALRREAVLTAIVAAEGTGPSEQELLEAVAAAAEREGVEPEKLLGDLRKSGRLEEVREDLAARKAVELIAARATPIPAAQAQARERLWTPEKVRGERSAAAGSGRLWTPTDQRSTS
jgi:trigger factor